MSTKKSKRLHRSTSKKLGNLSLPNVADGSFGALASPRASSGSMSSRGPRESSGIPDIVHSRKDVSKLKKLRIGKLLLGNPIALLAVLESTTEGDVHSVSSAITTAFGSKLQALHLILYCTYRELDCTPRPELILRGGGLYTRILSMLASKASKEYLCSVLQADLERVANEQMALEIDPSKLEDKTQLETNIGNITRVCKSIIKALTRSVDELPEIVVLICKEMHNAVKAKFPGHEGTAISGFLILRIICPALTQPDQYDLLQQCPSSLRRKLILVAKVLQAVFNDAQEKKEKWMESMTSFIKSNQKTRKILVRKILARKGLTGTGLVKYLATTPDAKKEEHKRAEGTLKSYCSTYGREIFPFVDTVSEASEVRVGSLERALQREAELLGTSYQGIQETWVSSAREWCFVQIFSSSKRTGVSEEPLTHSAESRISKKRLQQRVRSLGDIFDFGKDAIIGAKVEPTRSPLAAAASPPAAAAAAASPRTVVTRAASALPAGSVGAGGSGSGSGSATKTVRTGSVPTSSTQLTPRRSQPYKEPRVEYYRFTLHHVFDLPHEFSVRKGSTHYKRLRSVASKHLNLPVTDLLVEVNGQQVPLTQDLLEDLLEEDPDARLDLHVLTRNRSASNS